jgi:hypothetical protein
LAILFGIALAGGVSYWGGQRLAQNAGEETLQAITQAVSHTQATQDTLNQTATSQAAQVMPSPTPSPTHTASPTPETLIGQVAALRVPLYALPDVTAPVVALLDQDTIVSVLGTTPDNTWFWVAFYAEAGEHREGYVLATGITMTGGPPSALAVVAYPSPTPTSTATPTQIPTLPPSPSPTPMNPLAVVQSVSIPFYSAPDENAPVLTVLPQDSLLRIVGMSEDGLWYMVEAGGGRGFVRRDLVEVIGGNILAVPFVPRPTDIPVVALVTATPDHLQAQAAADVVVVRQGPALSFPIVGVLGDTLITVNALSSDGQWLQIPFPASPTRLGWVALNRVNLSGNPARLPIVQGPPAPTPIVAVIIDGQLPVDINPSLPPDIPPLTVVRLPDNFHGRFNELANLETYAYAIGFLIEGTIPNGPYVSTLRINVAENRATDEIQATLNGVGDLGNLSEVQELFPTTLGSAQGQTYIYFPRDEVCFPSENVLTVPNVLGEYLVGVSRSTERILEVFRDEGVFGLVDEKGLVGIPGTHYRFLGFRDPASPVDNPTWQPSENIKIDLWFDPSGQILFAFALQFDFNQSATIPDTVWREILFNVPNARNFTGRGTLFQLPIAVGENVNEYTRPPAPCAEFLSQ